MILSTTPRSLGRGGRLAPAGAVLGAAVLLAACGGGPAERIDEIYELKNDPTAGNVEEIRRFLDDDDPQVRVTAMYLLVELGVPDGRTLALEALDDEEPFVRKMGAQQLRTFEGPEVTAALSRRAIEDVDDRVRRQAAETLGRVGGPGAVAALGECLTDPVADVRIACVESVARLDPAAHVPTLIRLLADDLEWKVRVQAARALGMAGDRTAVPALTEAANTDVHEYVRGAAAHALARVREAPERPAPPAEDDAIAPS